MVSFTRSGGGTGKGEKGLQTAQGINLWNNAARKI